MIIDVRAKPGIIDTEKSTVDTPDLPDPISFDIENPASSYQYHIIQPRIYFIDVSDKPRPCLLSRPLLQLSQTLKMFCGKCRQQLLFLEKAKRKHTDPTILKSRCILPVH